MNQNFLNQDTLWKSEYNLKSLRSFRIRRWESSDQLPNNLTKTFWQLQTNVSYQKFLECKKLELFLKGLPLEELQCLFDAPGVLDDELFTSLLRAKNDLRLNLMKEEHEIQLLLLRRLRVLQLILGLPLWSQNLLYTYKGNLKYELQLVRVAIRKVKKFSGWVRNSSAVGSKRKSRDLGYNPEIFGVILDEEFDYYSILMTPELDYLIPGTPEFTIKDLDPLLLKSFLHLKRLS